MSETKEKQEQKPGFFAFIARRIAEHRKAKWQSVLEKTREGTSVVHINDCADNDARLRLSTRSSELVGRTEAFAGATSDLEAAGLLIDALDALDGAAAQSKKRHNSVILVNVAPRHGDAQKHENGTPFCYFRYKGTLVVATLDGLILSLLKKFGLIEGVIVLDTRATLQRFASEGLISNAEAEDVAKTQFRSYEFSPRVAAYLLRRGELPGTHKTIEDVADAPSAVWFIDNFGNCKTTLTLDDIEVGTTVATRFGTLPFSPTLANAPEGIPAVVVGSSGIGGKRFLEIVIKGGSAAKHFEVAVGDTVLAS